MKGEIKRVSEILKPIMREIIDRKELDAEKPSDELANIIYELCRDSNVADNRLEIIGGMGWSELKKRQLKRAKRLNRALSIIKKRMRSEYLSKTDPATIK